MDSILSLNHSAVEQYFQQLYPNYSVKRIECTQGQGNIYLEPSTEAICPDCGRECSKVHQRIPRSIREVPLPGQLYSTVHVDIRRVKCTHCGGRKQERRDWVANMARLTKRFAIYLQAQLRVPGTTNSSLALKHNLSWTTIKNLDKQQLEYYFDGIDLTEVRYLAIDEFSIKKGHAYATAFMDLETGRIIHVCEGRTVEKVRHFFEHLINKGLEGQVQMVCVDMHAGYHSLVKEYLPQAVVVYDLFHVMQHFGQDVLKAAVSSCARSFSQNHQQKLVRGYRRQLRKSSWFILASDSSPLKHADSKTYYEEIIRDNELLFMLQPIADLLRGIWQAEDAIEASNRLDDLAGLLDEVQKKFKFPAAGKFKRMLTKRAKEIVKACLFKGFGTNRLEGANAKIKNIKRSGYGFRDMKYFFLKIKGALPGDGIDPWNYLTDEMGILTGKVQTCTITGRFASSG